MGKTAVTFVVCTHNNRTIVEACLRSIQRQLYADWTCIVVDDTSADGTPQWIESNFPWVKLLHSERNLGPCHCRNLGVIQSDSPYVAFLDSDVELDAGWLQTTVPVLESDPSIGIVGGKLLFAVCPERINSYGGAMGKLGLAWDDHEFEESSSLAGPTECLFVCSAAILTRRATLQLIDGWDDKLFYGYDDTDLGWRASLYGYRSVCVPQALAYHRQRQTVCSLGDLVVFHYCKNRLRSMLENYGTMNLVRYVPLYLLYSALDIAMRRPRTAKLKALWWNAAMLPDTLRRRGKIQRERRTEDSQLEHLFCPRFFPPVPLQQRRDRLAALLAGSSVTSPSGVD